MKYTLIAQNIQGASVTFNGNTKQNAILEFDAIYNRTGFIISIHDNLTGKQNLIKKTYK